MTTKPQPGMTDRQPEYDADERESEASYGTTNLPDVPDFSGVQDPIEDQGPFADGWYVGTIVERRESKSDSGATTEWLTEDVESQSGTSRNIRLQVKLVRKSDKRGYSRNFIVNYRPEDLTAETAAVVTRAIEVRKKAAELRKKDESKLTEQEAAIVAKDDEGWPEGVFRPFMTLRRLGTLQRIAGVKQLRRTEYGLDVTPLFGKAGFFRLGPDNRNPEYKAVLDFSDVAPKRAKVL